MESKPPIEFSNYANGDLESSLNLIDRDRFEHNFQACVAEIKKRKLDGTWLANESKEKQKKLLNARKWARYLALVQAIGGVFGFAFFAYVFGPQFKSGMPLNGVVFILFSMSVFAFAAWVGWKYWQTGIDTKEWRILLLLQIPGIQISNFAYQFYSGISVPTGIVQDRIAIYANLSSKIELMWRPQLTGFTFTINLVPIIALVLLNRIRQEK